MPPRRAVNSLSGSTASQTPLESAASQWINWLGTARPPQIAPAGDWFIWLFLGGRGAGKTRTGAEHIAWECAKNPGTRALVTAPTYADLLRVVFEGESGLLSVIPPECLATGQTEGSYTVSNPGPRIQFWNGSTIDGVSAEKPNRFRGPQFHLAWGDEFAAWNSVQEALDLLLPSVRLGPRPHVILTSTPKPLPSITRLRKDPRATVTASTTYDNQSNLSASFISYMRQRYAGTVYERQELFGELIEEVQGALFKVEWIEMARHIGPAPSSFDRIVVAIDPSGAASKDSDSDEIGIVAAGLRGNEAWVLSDASLRAGPADWGRQAVKLYRELQADALVAEANFGGAMVDHVIQAAARELRCSVNVKMVTASRGKTVRAEPISAHYAQGRVHHVGTLTALEDQLCQFTNSGYKGQGSPDRADAAIWALTELLDAGASVPEAARVMAFGRGTQHRVEV